MSANNIHRLDPTFRQLLHDLKPIVSCEACDASIIGALWEGYCAGSSKSEAVRRSGHRCPYRQEKTPILWDAYHLARKWTIDSDWGPNYFEFIRTVAGKGYLIAEGGK